MCVWVLYRILSTYVMQATFTMVRLRLLYSVEELFGFVKTVSFEVKNCELIHN